MPPKIQGNLPLKAPCIRGNGLTIHIDYAGPVEGVMLLIIVDTFSKWIDVHVVEIKGIHCSTWDCWLNSQWQWKLFYKCWIPGFLYVQWHQTYSDFHIPSSSNGLAERAAQIMKGGLKLSLWVPDCRALICKKANDSLGALQSNSAAFEVVAMKIINYSRVRTLKTPETY